MIDLKFVADLDLVNKSVLATKAGFSRTHFNAKQNRGSEFDVKTAQRYQDVLVDLAFRILKKAGKLNTEGEREVLIVNNDFGAELKVPGSSPVDDQVD